MQRVKGFGLIIIYQLVIITCYFLYSSAYLYRQFSHLTKLALRSYKSNLLKCLIVCSALISTECLPSSQHEEILGLQTVIRLHHDASIDVTETIAVYANRDKIRYGLTRRLPLYFTDPAGNKHVIHYQHLQALLNNQESDYQTYRTPAFLQIHFGSPYHPLRPDIYLYTLRYHCKNMVIFGADHDAFLWTLVQSHWQMPILKAQTQIILPKEATIERYQIAEENEVRNMPASSANNQLRFVTTRPLHAKERLMFTIRL